MSLQAGAMAAGAVLATFADVGGELNKYNSIMNNSRSLIGVSQAARVEPLTLVDSTLVHLDYMPDVLQTLQSQFTGFWLQALAMLTDLNGVNVARILDPINPSRDPDYVEFTKSIKRRAGMETFTHMCVEAYKWALPTAGQRFLSAEADDNKSTGQAVSDSAVKEVKDAANLAVGKLINVKVKNNGEEATVPVAIRLMVVEMDPTSLTALVGDKSQNDSFKNRVFDWRAGRLSFISDLVLCNDLIKERKRMLTKDKEGVYSEVRRRQQQHKKAGMLSGRASAAEASNLYVISKNSIDNLAMQFGYDIDNFSHREKIFENTAAMIIAVVDPDYERVTFYHNGLRQSSSLGIRDIKVANKGTGPNIMDIFQAYKEGAAPRF